MELIISPSASIVFESEKMKIIIHEATVACFNSLPVLITSPTGVGKELVAQYIHDLSERRLSSLVAVNCGALDENLFSSEFFGHEKGSFTGADKQHIGYLEESNNGTLFLDEIGDLSLNNQVKILKVLQDNKFRKLGGKKDITWTGRLISATNKNLKQLVPQKKFRKDLYFRLEVLNIEVPPLEERKEDILAIIAYLFDKYTALFPSKLFYINSKVKNYLLEYNWPGNVRELENILVRAIVKSYGNSEIKFSTLSKDVIDFVNEKNEIISPELTEIESKQDTGRDDSNSKKRLNFNQLVIDFEISLIQHALNESGNNKAKAAESLNLNRITFIDKLKKYNLI